MFVASVFSTPAFADVQSYCEVFGKDFANEKTSDVDQWQMSYRNAFNDCMTQYTADATVAAPDKKAAEKVVEKAPEKVVVVPARDFSRKKRIPIMEPGSIVWNRYCAAKYASFDAVTGNYRSHTGKQKPCLVTSD
jgi:BA14K-like protein